MDQHLQWVEPSAFVAKSAAAIQWRMRWGWRGHWVVRLMVCAWVGHSPVPFRREQVCRDCGARGRAVILRPDLGPL